MTKEELKRGKLLEYLINDPLLTLSNISNSTGPNVIGNALIVLEHRDEKFKKAFESIVDETKKRLLKEFEEL